MNLTIVIYQHYWRLLESLHNQKLDPTTEKQNFFIKSSSKSVNVLFDTSVDAVELLLTEKTKRGFR